MRRKHGPVWRSGKRKAALRYESASRQDGSSGGSPSAVGRRCAAGRRGARTSTVAGTATSGREGLALVTELRPDVLVTGIMMPEGDLDGIEVVAQAECEIVPTLQGDRALALRRHGAHRRGPRGGRRRVRDQDRASGRPSFRDPAGVRTFGLPARQPAGSQAQTSRAATEDLPDLTRRELEILQLVAEGHSNTQLAKMLWVTEQTVKFHLSNVYRKLEVANRTEASRWAQLHGLLGTSATATTTRPGRVQTASAGTDSR